MTTGIRHLVRILPPLGWLCLFAALTLTMLGLLGMFSAEADLGGPPAKTLRQGGHLVVGLLGLIAIQIVGYRRIQFWAYPLFVGTLILLVMLILARSVPLLAVLMPERRFAYRWIVLGPINIQVSEYAKIVFILALASYLRFRTSYRSLGGLLVPFVLCLVPLGLILKEPDLGTSLLLLPTLIVMLFAAGAKNRHLLPICGLGMVAAVGFYYSPFMSDYQRDRIHSLFRQNDDDPRWRMKEGYQLSQSKIALGSGRWTGQGFRQGAFFRYNLLPEEHNDFIFAVLGHQWGFLGSVGVIGCYLVIIASGLRMASKTTNAFGRLIAVGVCALIFAQAFINIGMTIGLMPITGVCLPFVSSGGSGLVASYLLLGLLISVGSRQPIDMGRRPFEFDTEEQC